MSIGLAAAVADGTVIFAPDYPTFAHLDLRRWVESRTARPAVIENDMNAAVYGYGHTHELAGDQSIVYVYLGKNGPGAGILINGQLIRGKTGFSGEISFYRSMMTRRCMTGWRVNGRPRLRYRTRLSMRSVGSSQRLPRRSIRTPSFFRTLTSSIPTWSGFGVCASVTFWRLTPRIY
ncbi:ROK family protein [Exiguobacterium sp. AM39-5BH]|uniref:ROK family protein n=1 Tax=Exiguobacterium sp. AM39-5BH TaxID=2292355 RepID=UPI001F1F0E1D|nr:ROK family protein [Exiguobacterium sp. AM39-5BH]